MLSPTSHGGKMTDKNKGGRPSLYGEPTKPVRIPISWINAFNEWVEEMKNRPIHRRR